MRLRAIGLAAALLAFAAPALAQPRTEVRIAMLAPGALNWLHAIARDRGFYTEAGLEVRELVAATSPALIQAITSGSVEAGLAVPDLVIRAVDNGGAIILGAAVLDRSILRLVSGPGITQPAELARMPVTAGAVEGGTANMLRFLLQRNGVDARGVQMVSMANSRDRIVALQNRQVRGALLTAPFDVMAMNAGMRVIDTYGEPYLQIALAVNPNWVRANPAAARGLARSIARAGAWIYDPANKDAAIDILVRLASATPDDARKSYEFIVEQQHAFSRTGEIPLASLENLLVIDRAVAMNPPPPRTLELRRYVDASLVRPE